MHEPSRTHRLLLIAQHVNGIQQRGFIGRIKTVNARNGGKGGFTPVRLPTTPNDF